jgi:hypothetical protein
MLINVIDQIMNGWWIIKKNIIRCSLCYVEIQLHRVSKFAVLMCIFLFDSYSHSNIKSQTITNIQLMNYYWPLCQRSSLNSFRINVLFLSGILARSFSMNIYYCCNYRSNHEWLMNYWKKYIIRCSLCYVEIQLHRVSKFVVLMCIFLFDSYSHSNIKSCFHIPVQNKYTTHSN